MTAHHALGRRPWAFELSPSSVTALPPADLHYHRERTVDTGELRPGWLVRHAGRWLAVLDVATVDGGFYLVVDGGPDRARPYRMVRSAGDQWHARPVRT